MAQLTRYTLLRVLFESSESFPPPHMSRKSNSYPHLCERPPTSSQTHRPSIEEVLLVREVDSVILNENRVFEKSASKKIISRTICVWRAPTPKLCLDASHAFTISVNQSHINSSQPTGHPSSRQDTHPRIDMVRQSVINYSVGHSVVNSFHKSISHRFIQQINQS
jgi:hypothetical protein